MNCPVMVIIEQIEKHFHFTFSHISNLQVIESFQKLNIIEAVASISVCKFELSFQIDQSSHASCA